MFNFNFKFIKNTNLFKKRWYSTVQEKTIVVASAVRTPIGFFEGSLSGISVQRLGAIVIQGALQRARCSAKSVNAIFMANTTAEKEVVDQIARISGLSNNVLCHLTNNDCLSGTESIIYAFKALNENKGEIVVACGVEAMSNEINSNRDNSSDLERTLLFHNTIATDMTQNQNKSFAIDLNARLQRALDKKVFDSEIEPITFRNKSAIVNMSKDDVCDNGKTIYTDGGCAMVLMTSEKADELACKPLAKIMGYADVELGSDGLSASYKPIIELLKTSKVDKNQIALMQVNEITSHMDIKQLFNSINKINIHGDFSSLGGFSGLQSVTHLLHILKENQIGCSLISTKTRAMAVLVKKLPNQLPFGERRPKITLYTKEPCPLCDELVNDLEVNFNGKYELDKIFIDDPKNERYFDLYRYDIPVLFFNGQYLCKHRLNKDLLNKKLIELKL